MFRALVRSVNSFQGFSVRRLEVRVQCLRSLNPLRACGLGVNLSNMGQGRSLCRLKTRKSMSLCILIFESEVLMNLYSECEVFDLFKGLCSNLYNLGFGI